MFNYKIIFRFFSLVFIAGIFFGLNNVLGLEEGFKVCSPQGPSCSNQCRTGTLVPYSTNSNGGTVRVSAMNWFINGYQFDKGYSSDVSDKVKSDRFMDRYGLSNSSSSNVRQIQQKINKIAESGKCSAVCEDGRFGNDTISKMASCLCMDADASPINFGGDCGVGFISDGKNCCSIPDCSASGKMPLVNGSCTTPGWTGDGAGCCIPDCSIGGKMSLVNGSCTTPGWTGDNNGCCIEEKFCNNTFTQANRDSRAISDKFDKDKCCWKIATKPGTPTELSTHNFCDGLTGCSAPLKPLSGGVCTTYGSGWAADGSCCKQFCTNLPVGTGCSGPYENKPIPGGNCCVQITCQTTGQVPQVNTGGSYSCQPCGSGTIANADHTKCICDSTQKCCGIQLNTVVPFIGDCIEMSNDESAGNTTRVNALNAFPILMGSLSKMLVTAILIFSFVMIVIGGVLIIAGGIDPSNAKSGKDIIKGVIIGLALLGASGIILRLINPNFFG